jgi:hypothetical protein
MKFRKLGVLLSASFSCGYLVANFDDIRSYFQYSCKGTQILVTPEMYSVFAQSAVYQKHSDLEVRATNVEIIEPSDADMFAPSARVSVSAFRKTTSISAEGIQTSAREVIVQQVIHVDGCGKTTVEQ